eukprot:CAMPEP_0197028848 /NCGR_PEP_ID=MMETSP1384-20130603/8437_1 /TAXON_ID=29189 /ORGANISM="Ammonia sp." /LENGTH=409 /DNA_ID=CAMNT_0042457913 /DNA_START=118 /DNA_END=1347 /DNA_ORIENTATION=+
MKHRRISAIQLFLLCFIFVSLILPSDCKKRRTRTQTRKPQKNCYEKLGVPTDAHEKVIKKAFRKLALKYHPDKVKEEDREASEAKFKELAHCYEILSDKDQRQKYDASGYNEQFAQQPGGGGGGTFHFEGSFEDIFSNFFGKGNQFGFEDLFRGASGGRTGGSGAGGGFQSFHFGGGGPDFGQQQAGGGPFGGFGGGQQQQNMYGQHHQHSASQRAKKAKREKVYVDLESLMEDSFVTAKTKKFGSIEIEVPKGCPEGQVVKENGVEFEVYTKPHDRFRRGERSHKSDLYMNESITLEQALLGFKLEITAIDGELIEEWIESIPHSKELQVKRKGLSRFGKDSTTRGHLYVHFDVELPVLNEEKKQELKQHLAEYGSWDYSEAKKYRKKQEEREKKRRSRRQSKDKTEL